MQLLKDEQEQKGNNELKFGVKMKKHMNGLDLKISYADIPYLEYDYYFDIINSIQLYFKFYVYSFFQWLNIVS